MTKLTGRMPTGRKLALGLALAATAITGTAYAQQAGRIRQDADGSGAVTRAETQAHAAASFARMDANKDGKLDSADREARRNMVFDRMDADKNGQLSRGEFSARPDRAPRAKAAASDGEHGKRGGWHKRGGKRGWGHGGTMGRMADADKNGVVTQAEFTAAALQRFDRLDANKDGQVTPEERRAAHQAMREEWRAKREAAKPATPAS